MWTDAGSLRFPNDVKRFRTRLRDQPPNFHPQVIPKSLIVCDPKRSDCHGFFLVFLLQTFFFVFSALSTQMRAFFTFFFFFLQNLLCGLAFHPQTNTFLGFWKTSSRVKVFFQKTLLYKTAGRTSHMRPDKSTSTLPLHCGRELSDNIFWHFVYFNLQFNIRNVLDVP